MIQIQLMDRKVSLAPVCIRFMNLGQIIIEALVKKTASIFKQTQKIRALKSVKCKLDLNKTMDFVSVCTC